MGKVSFCFYCDSTLNSDIDSIKDEFLKYFNTSKGPNMGEILVRFIDIPVASPPDYHPTLPGDDLSNTIYFYIVNPNTTSHLGNKFKWGNSPKYYMVLTNIKLRNMLKNSILALDNLLKLTNSCGISDYNFPPEVNKNYLICENGLSISQNLAKMFPLYKEISE